MKWIFFDLDDTIWNFSENSTKSLHKVYALSPILRKLFKTVEEFIEIYHRNNFLMWELLSQGRIDSKQLKVERWRTTLATRQFEVLTAVCEELDTTYLDLLAKEKEMIPGVEDILTRVSKEYLIGVLSNGFADTQYKKLRNSGLDKFVTRTIVSEEIGINKPDKRLFEYAMEETGATGRILMVGDNPISDIYGALRAGWYAIWYNPKGKELPYSTEDLKKEGINPELLFADVRNIDELEREIQKFSKL